MSQEVKTLVTAAGPLMAPLLDHSLPSFRQYGEAQGYNVIAEHIGEDSHDWHSKNGRAARWAKLGIIRKALQTSDIAVWFDADIVICRRDEDIADHLRDDSFQALTIEQVPSEHRVNPNTGVWVMRHCTEAFDFLDAVEEAGPQPGPWMDQGAVLKVLGWERGDERYYGARPGLGSEYLQHTSWLPVGWNQPFVDRPDVGEVWSNRPTEKFPCAVHFMGIREISERAATMANFCASLTAQPAIAAIE
jgi:hypothetical protein